MRNRMRKLGPSEETRTVMTQGTWLWIWGTILVVAIVVISLVLYPMYINWRRNAVQHSNPYVQTRVQQLTDNMSAYSKLETDKAKYKESPDVVVGLEAQQRQLVNQMWQTYDLIPNDIRSEVVPPDVQMFLASHPR